MSAPKKASIKLLTELISGRGRSMNQFATELGINHSTISRWCSGKYTPSTRSWQKIAEHTGISLEQIFSTEHGAATTAKTEPPDWPEFREYATKKYPNLLNEDLITMVEGILESNKRKKNGKRAI